MSEWPDLDLISDLTEGYSGADMANLAKEAAMGPIRSLDYSKIDKIEAADVRPIGGRYEHWRQKALYHSNALQQLSLYQAFFDRLKKTCDKN